MRRVRCPQYRTGGHHGLRTYICFTYPRIYAGPSEQLAPGEAMVDSCSASDDGIAPFVALALSGLEPRRDHRGVETEFLEPFFCFFKLPTTKRP